MEEEAIQGAPEWVVTYGDMMSLLLTFFIMLVSLSEVKDEERYQAMVESMLKRFGYESSAANLAPGTLTPRNSHVAKLATDGRARRLNAMQGGDKVQASVGDYPRVHIVRPGEQTGIGTVIFFPELTTDLSEQNKQALREVVVSFRGKPHKIEVRGHTAPQPLPKDSPYANHWELAYQRCCATMKFLTDELGIDQRRIRMSVAGSNEPMQLTADPAKQRQNSRVEVFLLNETVDDLTGTAQERAHLLAPDDPP